MAKGLGYKDSVRYNKLFPNPEGRKCVCPKCGGGTNASVFAKKKKLPPIKGVPCFTCWGYGQGDKVSLSPKVKTMLTKVPRHKRKGRTATIRRSR